MEAEVRAIVSAAVNAPAPDDRLAAIERVQEWVAQSAKRLKEKPKGPVKRDSVEAFLRDRRRNAIREAIDDGRHPRELFRGEYARIVAEAGWTTDYIDQLVKQSRSS